MGTTTTLSNDLVEQFMSITQEAVLVLSVTTNFRRQLVTSSGARLEEEIFVLTAGWGVSQDGDHYWVETRDGEWHVYDACNITSNYAHKFTNELRRLIR